MCTCIALTTQDHYFGRNLDLEYRFNEQVVITPREYEFKLKNHEVFSTKYAMIGMATVMHDYPLYAEATNEKGLSMAGLYFPANAVFFDEKEGSLNLTPYELIPYLLGQYSTVSEIKELVSNLNITNIPFEKNIPVSELHWMMNDAYESIVLEQTSTGLKIYDNPIGVLTNNPPFDYHLANIRNYMNLTPCSVENNFSNKIDLKSYGQGMGAIGLPGDASPASRFVRAAFNKLNAVCEKDEMSSVTQFFHILDSVAMVSGSVITQTGQCDITTYSCCINTSKGIYYYKTYTNNQLTAIKMTNNEKIKAHLSIYPLIEQQQIRYENE